MKLEAENFKFSKKMIELSSHSEIESGLLEKRRLIEQFAIHVLKSKKKANLNFIEAMNLITPGEFDLSRLELEFRIAKVV